MTSLNDSVQLHSPIPTKPSSNSDSKHPSSTLESRSESKVKEKKMPSLVVKPDPNLKSCLSNTSQNNIHDHQSQDNDQGHPSFFANDTISPNMHGLIDEQLQQFPSVSQQFPNVTTPETSQLQQPTISRVNSLRYSEQDDKKFIGNSRQSSSTNITNIDPEDNKLSSFHEYFSDDKKLHLLIGISGCISINKNVFLIIEKLFELYTHEKLEIQVILTESAEYILSEKLYKLEQLGVKVWFHDDGDKYFLTSPFQKIYTKAVSGNISMKSKITPQVFQQYNLAYDLQRWTDVLLLAPLSANTMAKLINGLGDNLLTDLLHVWPLPHQQPTMPVENNHIKPPQNVISNNVISPKPIVTALALTTSMYGHPITKKQLGLLQETYPNMLILKPVEKIVENNGNIGMGGMRSWREVVDFVCKKLGPPPEEEEEEEEDDEEEEKEETNDIEKNLDTIKENQKLEIHQDETLPPIINESRKTSVDSNDGFQVKDDLHLLKKHEERKRGNTISRKELAEHERLASENAILNSNIGLTPIPSIKE